MPYMIDLVLLQQNSQNVLLYLLGSYPVEFMRPFPTSALGIPPEVELAMCLSVAQARRKQSKSMCTKSSKESDSEEPNSSEESKIKMSSEDLWYKYKALGQTLEKPL